MGKKCLIFIPLIFCVGLIVFLSNKYRFDNVISPTDIEKPKNCIANSEQYLRKIWVVDDWDGGAYYYSSFFISKINNKILDGKFSIHSIAEPDFYFYSLEPSKYLGSLYGTINNGEAECHFNDKVGNKGNVKLIFEESDKITATIEYTDKGDIYEDLYLDGTFSFRPYNLDDIDNFTVLKDHSFAVDLNSWGNVNFVSGKVDTGRVIHPVAYLTNKDNDIFYSIDVAFKTGSEINDVKIVDINNDGLKDIKIVTSFIGDPEIDPITFTFLQDDDGLFFSP
ncbi:hypothetical protein [Dethiothermospora halolimnae]|uniref:hypothetical protein n=1 Tax=Dethiothermospora halolimnae TaxID=3114390 RepID=UPI003CCBC786